MKCLFFVGYFICLRSLKQWHDGSVKESLFSQSLFLAHVPGNYVTLIIGRMWLSYTWHWLSCRWILFVKWLVYYQIYLAIGWNALRQCHHPPHATLWSKQRTKRKSSPECIEKIRNKRIRHQWRSQPDIWSCKCKFFCVYRPYKESISTEMNNDLNLYLHDQISGWLRYSPACSSVLRYITSGAPEDR